MDLSGVPDLEYLSSATLTRVHAGLYVNPRHVVAAYRNDNGVAVLLLSTGREVAQPGVDLDVLVSPLI